MGAVSRLIESEGEDYTIRNATGGGGGRDVPDYSDDGTLTGVLELRSRTAQTTTDSSGEEVETNLIVRAVVDSSTTIREAGESGGWPTLLDHPDGQTYRVVAKFSEDSGVTVLSVVRD